MNITRESEWKIGEKKWKRFPTKEANMKVEKINENKIKDKLKDKKKYGWRMWSERKRENV